MKVALLIVDMQKGCREITQCKSSFDNSVEYINEVSQYFRKKNNPVVIIKDIEVGSPGTIEFEIVEDIVISDKDIVVHKQHCNSFWETELDEKLKTEGVDCIIVSGFSAEHCVLFTYNGARERGNKVFLLQNGIAGFEEEEIKRIELLRPVINYEALEYFL
ncbi:MAG: cysteine hydrolase [Clostridiaceae bacterium]|nr:cysteine hydrolase [Clostridiaceae bacterium]